MRRPLSPRPAEGESRGATMNRWWINPHRAPAQPLCLQPEGIFALQLGFRVKQLLSSCNKVLPSLCFLITPRPQEETEEVGGDTAALARHTQILQSSDLNRKSDKKETERGGMKGHNTGIQCWERDRLRKGSNDVFCFYWLQIDWS